MDQGISVLGCGFCFCSIFSKCCTCVGWICEDICLLWHPEFEVERSMERDMSSPESLTWENDPQVWTVTWIPVQNLAQDLAHCTMFVCRTKTSSHSTQSTANLTNHYLPRPTKISLKKNPTTTHCHWHWVSPLKVSREKQWKIEFKGPVWIFFFF